MVSKEIEFRGISRGQLAMYFEELGAKQMTDTFPYVFTSESWCGQILSEQEILFTTSFKVNAVQVRFEAENDDILLELMKKYRYKTTRIGG